MGSAYAYAYERPSGCFIGHWITDCCDDVGFNKIASTLLTKYNNVDAIGRLVERGEMPASELVFGGNAEGRVQTFRKMFFSNVFDIEAQIFTRKLDCFPDAFFLFQGCRWTFVTPRRSRYNGKDVWDFGNPVPSDRRYYGCSPWKKLRRYVTA